MSVLVDYINSFIALLLDYLTVSHIYGQERLEYLKLFRIVQWKY